MSIESFVAGLVNSDLNQEILNTAANVQRVQQLYRLAGTEGTTCGPRLIMVTHDQAGELF